MGTIQNSINQLLGTAGIAAKLSPGVQKMVDIRDTKSNIENLKNSYEAMTAKDNGEFNIQSPGQANMQMSLGNKLIKEQENLLALQPNEELANKIASNYNALDTLQRAKIALDKRDELIRAGQQTGDRFKKVKEEIFSIGGEQITDPEFLALIKERTAKENK